MIDLARSRGQHVTKGGRVTKTIDESEDTDDAKTEQAFANYDLKAEAPEARKPTVRFAFEFQTLLEMFIPADVEALEARKTSRVAGITAVALVLSAMLLASLGPILSSAGHASAPAEAHGAAPRHGGTRLLLALGGEDPADAPRVDAREERPRAVRRRRRLVAGPWARQLTGDLGSRSRTALAAMSRHRVRRNSWH